MAITYTDKQIWDLLMKDIRNPYGVAGIMGNLRAESNMNPNKMTGGNSSLYASGMIYANKVDTGKITKEAFCHDGIAFGLAQWLYWSRKEALYDYAIRQYAANQNFGIGSVHTQIGYLLIELPQYKTAWETVINAKSVKEASDIIMLKYERPSDTSDTMKDRRTRYGLEYFEAFNKDEMTDTKEEQKNDIFLPVKPGVISKIRTTADKVFVRIGNGKEYTAFDRIPKKGMAYNYVATADNGWYAIKYNKGVYWISAEFSEPIYE